MTQYQEAVAAHMETAPEELREYVCGRLKESRIWKEDRNPIDYCGFIWDRLLEGYDFWRSVYNKDWQEAMATRFWQSRTKEPSGEDPLTPIAEMEVGDVFSFGTGRWKIVSFVNGKAECERLPDVITLDVNQKVPKQ